MCCPSSINQVRNWTESDEACRDVLDAVEPIGGRGGVIAVTKDGDVATPFQTMLMYRGVWKDGEITIGIGPNDVDLDSMD